MNTQTFGGNAVKQFNLGKQGKELLGAGPYQYFYYQTGVDEEVVFSELKSFSLYVYSKPDGAAVTVEGLADKLEQGDRVQSEGIPVRLKVQGGAVRLLVAGTIRPHPELKGLVLTRHSEALGARIVDQWPASLLCTEGNFHQGRNQDQPAISQLQAGDQCPFPGYC